MIFLLGLGFILGTVIGSFIDCLAQRSLTNKSFWGRSYCDRCKKTLAWYDLFPVFSYLFLQGQCRYCHKKFPPESLIVEVLMGLLVSIIFTSLPINFLALPQPTQILLGLTTVFKVFVVSVFFIVLITDIKKGIIPNRITYPAVVIAFFYFVVSLALNSFFLFKSLSESALGKYLLPPHSDYFYRHIFITASPFISGILSALGVGLFFLILILVTRGRGMGVGDLKLGIFIGLVLGFPNSLIALLLAFLLGSLVGILLITIRKKHFGQTIPFGPFLSIGAIIALFYGDQILSWYVNSFPNGSIF